MPRIKSDQERGYIAAWMRRERIARGWSQKEMPSRLATVGFDVEYDYYRQIEAGPKHPGPDFLDALRRLFGSEPEPFPEPTTPVADLAALVARLDRQAGVIDRLAASVAQLAVAVGASHGLTHAAADGMTGLVLEAIHDVRSILLEHEPAPADTPPPDREGQVPGPKA